MASPRERPSEETYSGVAIALHWLIGIGVLAMFVLGWWMIDIPKLPAGPRAYWFNVHKSIGMTIGLLVVARIVWRLTHRPPPLPASMPAWQQRAAHVSHSLLYLCMVVMPVSGFLGSTFSPYPIKYFGITLFSWGWDLPALKAVLSGVHLSTVILFMALVALHIGAALKHLLISRDGVFFRMLPRLLQPGAFRKSVAQARDTSAQLR
jgi:cytochrome b561